MQPRVDPARGDRVTDQVNKGPELGRIFQNILLIALFVLLPGIEGSFFGWLYGTLPLLTFFYLVKYGTHIGNRIVLSGIAVALAGSLVFQVFEPVLMSLSLIPAGYVLAHAAIRRDTPASAGLKGFIALLGGWLGLIGIYTLALDISPYALFLRSINQGITEALEYYRQSNSVSSEALAMLEATFYQMKVALPLIMPAILTGVVLITIWFSMVAGNRILYQSSGKSPWPRYRIWQLPERLVWLVIAGAVCTLLPLDATRIVGINLLIPTSIIYCFQGLAIFSFFVHKWNVPILLRSFLYVMIVFQSLGTVILLGIGLADVWLDLRKLKTPPAAAEVTDT